MSNSDDESDQTGKSTFLSSSSDDDSSDGNYSGILNNINQIKLMKTDLVGKVDTSNRDRSHLSDRRLVLLLYGSQYFRKISKVDVRHFFAKFGYKKIRNVTKYVAELFSEEKKDPGLFEIRRWINIPGGTNGLSSSDFIGSVLVPEAITLLVMKERGI